MFVIHVNLLLPYPSLFLCGLLLPLWCFSISVEYYLFNSYFVHGQNNSKYHDRVPISNVQFQKISILSQQKGLEFLGGGGEVVGSVRPKKLKNV